MADAFSETIPHRSWRAAPAPEVAYMARPSDLVPVPRVCPGCGAPIVGLHLDLPLDKQGAGHRGSPQLAELGSYRRYLGPDALCSACQLRQVIADLFPPAPLGIRSPLEAEVADLRARLSPPVAVPGTAPETDTGIFHPGVVKVTELALSVLAKFNKPDHDAGIVGSYEAGRAYLPPSLGRHTQGDFGSVGTIDRGDAERGSRLGPLTSRLDRNAASIADGRGAVVSVFPLQRLDARGRVTENASLQLWTELGSRPLTLASLSHEAPTD